VHQLNGIASHSTIHVALVSSCISSPMLKFAEKE
jgi:hypothetical protein